MIFVGRYKGVDFYTDQGVIVCMFGWVQKRFSSIRACKLAITKWIKET